MTKPLLLLLLLMSAAHLTAGEVFEQELSEFHPLPCLDRFVFSLAFSPDGRTLATVGNATGERFAPLRLWDVETGRERANLQGHTAAIYDVVYAPDGKTLATAGKDKSVRVWAADGKPLGVMPHPSEVRCLAYSTDGSLIATGCRGDAIIRFWDVASRTIRREIQGRGTHARNVIGKKPEVGGIVFSPDGLTVASTAFEPVARLWEVETGKELKTFGGFDSTTKGIEFSPDGKVLAVASLKETRLFSVADGSVIHKISLVSFGEMAFSSDGATFYVDGRFDESVHSYDVLSGKPRTVYPTRLGSPALCLALSPDDRLIAVGGKSPKDGAGSLRLLEFVKQGAVKSK